ncbi:hypothetical protein AB5J62_12865 [Amycolatopsis sp. cg5]|uniref:hypothetical protein n=1 Tax=Amycolatopsis sp. cg5 TaxID=3238802 RepID=UPI0035257142
MISIISPWLTERFGYQPLWQARQQALPEQLVVLVVLNGELAVPTVLPVLAQQLSAATPDSGSSAHRSRLWSCSAKYFSIFFLLSYD